MDIPGAWEWSAVQIMQRQWRKVMVLGSVDRGKSTYCRFLAQRCLAAGKRVAVIDADVGQKDIGPPTTITLGYPEADVPWTHIRPAAMYFVGATTPVGHLLPMVVGLRHLLDTARANVIIINTTGFIHDVGRVLKSYKIEAVQPDAIVALERGRELTAITQAYRHYRVLRLPPSAQAVAKTPQQRKAAREQAFHTYFASAREVCLVRRQVAIQRTELFTNTRLTSPPECYQNLLCGVAGRRTQGLGLAILKRIDMANETFTLFTPVPAVDIYVIQFGDMYLMPDGQESESRPPRGL